MLHTIVDYNVFLRQMEESPRSRWLALQDGVLEVDDRNRVRRVCSTNPADYLNAQYTPGAICRGICSKRQTGGG